MKKALSLLILTLILVPSVLIFSACGNGGDNKNNNSYEVGYWETQPVSHIYTESELASLSNDELSSLKNKYIKIKCTVDSIYMCNNLYYTNALYRVFNSGDLTRSVKISGYSYQNYWEIPYVAGDNVYVEGYVSESIYNIYPMYSYLTINPCLITSQ